MNKGEIEKAKQLLNDNGYLILKIPKGCINLALECKLDQFDNKNCKTICADCFNKTCIKEIIKEQLL